MVKIIPRTAIPIGNREVVALSDRFLSSEDIIQQEVAEFENEFASYLGVRRIFAFNSGRTALYVALQALDLPQETEVIVPAYTCAIVFEVILRLGLKPVLVDVNPQTYNIDAHLIPRAITSKTKAMIPVHLFGQPCEMDKIKEVANDHDLFMIEDVAQALGAKYNNTKVGNFGDLAIFSFGPGKSMTSGEGGALAVNNADFTEKIVELQERLKTPDLNWNLTLMRNILAMKMFSKQYLYGAVRGRLEDSLGKGDEEIVENCVKLTQKGKSTSVHPTIRLAKMPSASAAIARMQLKKLDAFNAKRIRNADELSKSLHGMSDLIQLPKTESNAQSTFTRYTIRLLKQPREPLMTKLLMKGIDTEKPYDYLSHLFKTLKIDAPKAEELAKSTLTLPNHPLVRIQDITKIANTLTNEINSQSKISESEGPQ